jgi:hypothetical protein
MTDERLLVPKIILNWVRMEKEDKEDQEEVGMEEERQE